MDEQRWEEGWWREGGGRCRLRATGGCAGGRSRGWAADQGYPPVVARQTPGKRKQLAWRVRMFGRPGQAGPVPVRQQQQHYGILLLLVLLLLLHAPGSLASQHCTPLPRSPASPSARPSRTPASLAGVAGRRAPELYSAVAAIARPTVNKADRAACNFFRHQCAFPKALAMQQASPRRSVASCCCEGPSSIPILAPLIMSSALPLGPSRVRGGHLVPQDCARGEGGHASAALLYGLTPAVPLPLRLQVYYRAKGLAVRMSYQGVMQGHSACCCYSCYALLKHARSRCTPTECRSPPSRCFSCRCSLQLAAGVGSSLLLLLPPIPHRPLLAPLPVAIHLAQ